MPKIPVFQPNLSQSPQMSPGAASVVGNAYAQAGQQVEAMANRAQSVYGQIQEKEKKIERTLKATQIEKILKQKESDYTTSLRIRTDYQNFEPDRLKLLEEARTLIEPIVGDDRELQAATEKAIGSVEIGVGQAATLRKYKIYEQQGVEAMDFYFNDAMVKAADLPPEDVEGRIALRSTLDAQGKMLVSQGLIAENKLGDYLRSFDEQTEVRRADAFIDNARTATTALLLQGKTKDAAEVEKQLKADIKALNLPVDKDLVMMNKAQSMVKASETEARVLKNQAKSDQKEAEANMKKRELVAFGNAVLKKDYSAALQILDQSNLITNKVELMNQVTKASEEADPFKKSDPEFIGNLFIEAALGMVDPETIFPVPDKLSRTDYTLVKGLAEYAQKPEKKYINDLTGMVLQEVDRQIFGVDDISALSLTESVRQKYASQAGIAKRFILSALMKAETDEDKTDLLDQTSKNFILPKAFQAAGFEGYSIEPPRFKSKTSPGLFYPSAGSQKSTLPGKRPVKSLWEEK